MSSPRNPLPTRLFVPVAALVVAALAPMGPGAWLTMHAIAATALSSPGASAFTFPSFGPTFARDVVVDTVALALLAYLPRLVLAIATTQDARSDRVEPLRAIRRSLGLLVRTRGVSLMVATFTFGATAWVLLAAAERLAVPLAADVCRTLAAIVVTAGFGMASLADRAAVLDVSGAQDARAARLRSESRHAGPHYLDTSTARRGYDVATSADDATTVGMKAFLRPWAWAAAFVAMVADALPVLSIFVASLVSPSVDPRTPLRWVAMLVIRAGLEVGVAKMWTRVYVGRTVPNA